MEQYISKSAVENILRNLWKEDVGHNAEHRVCYNKALQEVQCEIDTLEVKEVNLDKELENWLGERIGKWTGKECENMCRYFFELGLKAQKGE